MAIILRYFTEFGSVRGALSTSKRLQRDRATPTA